MLQLFFGFDVPESRGRSFFRSPTFGTIFRRFIATLTRWVWIPDPRWGKNEDSHSVTAAVNWGKKLEMKEAFQLLLLRVWRAHTRTKKEWRAFCPATVVWG